MSASSSATHPAIPLAGVVLAAGRSTRMGCSKALLPCTPDPDTFVARIVRTLFDAGLDRVAVVGRADDAPLRAEIASEIPRAAFVVNATPERGQLASLVAAIEWAEPQGVRGVLVMPVDLPRVRVGTVAALIAAASASPAPVLRVTCGGRGGHPVVFGAEVFDALRRADPAAGAKAVVRAHRCVDVAVEDEAVLRDVDRPEDYVDQFGPSARRVLTARLPRVE